MTELETRATVLQPLTGELVDPRDLPALGDALEKLREYRQQVSDAIAAFTEAVVAESRRLGTKTLDAGPVVLNVSADSEIEWDLQALEKLRDLGLPEERMNELVRPTVTYKVDGRVAKQLAGASPDYKVVIEAAAVRVPKRQYVTVKPR